MRTLISHGLVVNPAGREGYLDLLIEDDKIVSMGSLPADIRTDQKIDASGLCIAPGLVDTHVHFRDPGQTWKEDIFTGVEAAKRGGYTTVVMMANTAPPIDNMETLKYVLGRIADADIHVKTCATVTVGMNGEKLTDMPTLAKAGAVGFSDDGKPIMDEELVRQAMYIAKDLGVPVSLHEEDPEYIETPGFDFNHAVQQELGITGASRRAEYEMIHRDVRLAIETGATVNIQHVSTMEGADFIRWCKVNGHKNIHAEITPHHLALTAEDAIRLGAMAKMNPPLRLNHDRARMVTCLHDGYIDLIATDHAPHTKEEKERGLIKAPSGVIGLETALGVVLTELYHHAPEWYKMKLRDIIKCMSYNPAQMYGFDAGVLREGGVADIVIFDPEEKWTVGKDSFASKSSNSPFIGRELIGKVKYTICEGKIIYSYWQKK